MTMELRTWLAPREVATGDASVAELGRLLRRAGSGNHVAVIIDQAVVDAPAVAAGLQSLDVSAIKASVHVVPPREPDMTAVDSATDHVYENGSTAVVGVGGGSALDVAKLAAARAHGSRELSSIGAGQPRPPLILVPTTAGTGAEATRVAMVTIEGRKRIVSHPSLVPDAAILDPRLVESSPPGVTASSGLDALSHSIEAYLSLGHGPISEAMSLRGAELVAHALPLAYSDGSDMAARRATLFGAFLAGMGLSAGVILGHSMAYTIAHRTGLPHGITCALALPYCVAHALPAVTDRVSDLARACLGEQRNDPVGFIRWLASLASDLGAPTNLADAGVSRHDVEGMANDCVALYPRPTHPTPVHLQDVRELFNFAWNGDLDGALRRFDTRKGPARRRS